VIKISFFLAISQVYNSRL